MRASRSIFGRTAALLAVLVGASASAAVPDVPTSQTRTSRFEYYADTGLLWKEIVEPTDPALCIVTEFTYDSWGNKRTATTRNCNGSAAEAAAPAPGSTPHFTARTRTTSYDARGQFPLTVTNPANQSESHEYDKRFGAPTRLTGPNGLTTMWSYDPFGRKATESRADGTSAAWTYTLCQGASCNPRYSVSVTSSGAPTARTHFDNFAREIATDVLGLDGVTRWRQEQSYDALGRVVTKTRRFNEGDSAGRAAVTSSIDYDQLGRAWLTVSPAPQSGLKKSISYVTYEGLKITETDLRGFSTATFRNVLGQKERVVDARGAVLRYGYDAFGNLIGTDAAGVYTVMRYDVRGRKLEMDDPDIGLWRYEYDALGQVKKQTDAKSQVVTMQYDALGRMTQRTEGDLISYWEFDAHRTECGATPGKVVGKLARAWTSINYARVHCYDDKGRPTQERTTIGTETFVASTTYDTASRTSRITYPTGFQVEQRYTNGYLASVVDIAANKVLWQVNALDPNGQLTRETLGNGVVTDRVYDNLGRLTGIGAGAGYAVQNTTFGYDANGNVNARTWVVAGVTRSETFVYDETSRLTSVTGSNGPPNKAHTYDATGNVVTKTGVGTYWYIAGTHRLQWIQGTVNGVPNPSFAYDNNGNITGGAGYTTTYTSYNKPSRIQKSGSTTSDFTYGPEHQRIRQIAGTVTTLYVSSYERDTNSSTGLVQHKHYIGAGGALIAQYTTRSDGQPAQTRYMHRDHLSSVVAVTDESGAVVARYSYDAWGKRRNTDGTDAPVTTAEFDRGYTGHEMLDGLQLVHMNGRVYDPTLGRFTSADFVVPDPALLLGFNRYAYVYDNPLTLVDPSGHKPFWRKKWFKQYALPVIAIAVGMAVGAGVIALMESAALSSPSLATGFGVIVPGEKAAVFVASAAGKGVAGAAGGFAGSLVASGGDVKSAAQGALSGGVSGFVGGYFANEVSLTRVAAETATSAATAYVQGSDARRAAGVSFGFSLFGYLNVQMREAMIESSSRFAGVCSIDGVCINNMSGESYGLNGDMKKIGGGRIDLKLLCNADGSAGCSHLEDGRSIYLGSGTDMMDALRNHQTSPLGGLQGGQGFFKFLGNYAPGTIADRIVEAFSGPHDWFNAPVWYDSVGNIANLTRIEQVLGGALNYINVIPAAPFAIGGLVSPGVAVPVLRRDR